jgi:predicted GIY-YIG superfamily endonuclease
MEHILLLLIQNLKNVSRTDKKNLVEKNNPKMFFLRDVIRYAVS